MRFSFSLFLTLLLSACASAAANQVDPTGSNNAMNTLENFGKAPELDNAVWLNTDEPLRLANLRGKVVLLEMWTFG